MWDPNDRGNWWYQRGSFREPVPPPDADICDPPLVCLSFNASWARLLAGAATQLAQPSTWLVSSEAERTAALQRATDLIAEIGTAMACVSAPPVLGSTGTAQRACNIAGYLSNILIKTSIQKAIDSINQNQTLLGYGRLIIFAIPEVGVILPAIMSGLYGLYQAIEGGTLSDYQDAIDDPVLWSQLTCAIYTATSGDGQVTDTNFPTVQTNVAALSYVHAEVISTISNYLSDLGASGVEQLQTAGALAVYDCTSCGSGVSTGPSGLPVRQNSGTASLTILSGTGSITSVVSFLPPFGVAPIVTLQSQDPVLIASADTITTDGFHLTISAAVDVDADTAAVVDWWAVLPGPS